MCPFLKLGQDFCGPAIASNGFPWTRRQTSPQPPPAVAWHVFDELATLQMRRVCRMAGVTINSFLLKHLTKAIRPFFGRPIVRGALDDSGESARQTGPGPRHGKLFKLRRRQGQVLRNAARHSPEHLRGTAAARALGQLVCLAMPAG